MSLPKLLAAATLILSLSDVLAHKIPRETQIHEPLITPGWSPRPTEAPKVDLREIAKRDYLANSADYVLIAPDQTCGYVSGLAGADFACDSLTCVFFPLASTATGSTYGAVGCCKDPLDCGFRTACVDSAAYSASCDGGCQLDTYTMKCTESAKPNCGSIRYRIPQASFVQQYYCMSGTASTWQTASTTYSGQTGRGTFTSVKRAALASSSSSLTRSSTTSGSTTTTTTSSVTRTSATRSSTPTPSKESKSSTPVGAIVGGLIGGAAVLGLIGAGAFFIYKRTKKTNDVSPVHTPLNNLSGQPPSELGTSYQPGPFSPHPQQGGYLPYMSNQVQYQPVLAEMPADHYAHEKQAGVHELSPSQGYVSGTSPSLSVSHPASSGISPSSTINRHSMYPESLQQPGSPPPQHINPSQQYMDNPAQQYAGIQQQPGSPPQQYAGGPQQYTNSPPQQYGAPPQQYGNPSQPYMGNPHQPHP